MVSKQQCSCVYLLLLFLLVNSQTPVPHRPRGYVYQSASNPKVVVEVFYDHLCDDSKANWPTLQALKRAYSSDVEILIHIFPLPYHHNAYFVQEAGEVVRNESMDKFETFIDEIFKEQETFLSGSVDKTEPEVKASIAELVEMTTGVKKTIVMMGYDDEDIIRRSRYAWKYAAHRSITGTPQFIVNGVRWDEGSGYSVDDWKKVIDELIKDP